VDLAKLVDRYAYLWHVTFAGGCDGIRTCGFQRAIDLLPGSAAMIRLNVSVVGAADGKRVTIRNQVRSRVDPSPCLDGISVEDWWTLVNSRVYFFCRKSDAKKLRDSYLSQSHPQELIKLRTRPLLQRVLQAVELTTVNVGVFPRATGPSRGPKNFIRLAEFPGAELAKVREVTVICPVPVDGSEVVSVVLHEVRGPTRIFP
jgi:hypothetical protein